MTVLIYPNPALVPDTIKNVALKYAYIYAVQEALRLRHNEEGAKFRDGVITKKEWLAFLREWHDPRQQTIIADLVELRKLCAGYVVQFKDNIDLEGIPI